MSSTAEVGGKVEVPIGFDPVALKKMVIHCEADAPREACGALLGIGDMVMEVRPIRNIRRGNHHYEMHHGDLKAVHEETDQGLYDLLGWYHSHPATSSRPSDLDREMALPGYVYVILGLDGSISSFSAG